MYCISHQYFRLETGYFSPWQQAVICNFVALRGTTAFIAAVLLRGNARECVDCEFVEMRGTAKMRGNAWSRGLHGNASCEYVSEPRLECAGHEWEARGKCSSSAAQVRGTAVPRIVGSRIYTGPAR